MRAEVIAERVWPGRALDVEPLGGGITNHNFKVSLDGEAYVIRIGGERTELLGIDRQAGGAGPPPAAAPGGGPGGGALRGRPAVPPLRAGAPGRRTARGGAA